LARSQSDHAARYGKIPGGSMVVVALGKAGSGELMAGSDLDLMLIYDHAPDAESTGAKRLPASQYFARAAQNFVAALTVPTRHGPLYEVDMRLRPSGRMGPVAVSLASFTQYHRESAWTWERLALTRARMVAGPAALRRRVATAIATALRGADPARIRTDTADMRARLQRDKPPRNVWDIKNRIGGLMELELLVQALLLIHAARPGVLSPNTQQSITNLARIGALPPSDATLLAEADRFWRTIQGICRMSLGRQIPPDLPAPTIEKLLHATRAGPNEAALRATADATASKIRAAFVRHVGDIDTP
jgi:glutamate-ammonia-ligase adenylyltransferase